MHSELLFSAMQLPSTLHLSEVAGDSAVQCEGVLRHLPGKRLVYQGHWQGLPVVVKLFLDSRSARRHWSRERVGAEALRAASIATPELLYSGVLEDNTPVLIFAFLVGAQTFLEVFQSCENVNLKRRLLARLVEMVAGLHAAGLVQEDLHLENFLVLDKQLFAIDADAICVRAKKPLDLKSSSRNLALLFAQLAPEDDLLIDSAAQSYVENRNLSGSQFIDQLMGALPLVRRKRQQKYLKKCFRTCSEFIRSQRSGQVAVSRMDVQGENLNHLLADPDDFMKHGEILKAGNSSTVVRVQVDGCDWVVKRYNIKNSWHALRRCLRPTRAWVSWGNTHLLKISGIATPQAIAVIEKRIGPLRSTGYYVCDFIAGMPAESFFQKTSLQNPIAMQVAEKFVNLFELFHKLKICHGDCKATNFLLKDNEPWVIDLDAMQECSSPARFKRLFQVDRQRFLRNWQSQPELQRWFDEHIPGKVNAD